MFNVGDEAQREKNGSQVEAQPLRGDRKCLQLLAGPQHRLTISSLTCSRALAV